MASTKSPAWSSVALAVALLLGTASPAFAAPKSASLDALSVQVQPSDSILIVSGRVSATAKLPVTLRLPVPAGSAPYWVGEIIGSDPTKDPKASFTIEKADGYDLVVFTIKQGRTGQVEVTLPKGSASSAPVTLEYSLPIVSKVGQATISFGIPAGAAVTSSSAGLIAGLGASGGQVLVRTVQKPKTGSVIEASLTYSDPASAGGSAGPQRISTADALAVPLWILVLLVAAVFVRTVVRNRSSARAQDGDSDDDRDD